jgi:hypothetical protein
MLANRRKHRLLIKRASVSPLSTFLIVPLTLGAQWASVVSYQPPQKWLRHHNLSTMMTRPLLRHGKFPAVLPLLKLAEASASPWHWRTTTPTQTRYHLKQLERA